MYGKITEGRLSLAPKIIKIQISNPTEEQYRCYGYKEIVYRNPPEFDEFTQYLEETYTQTEKQIIVDYVIHQYELPQESDGEAE